MIQFENDLPCFSTVFYHFSVIYFAYISNLNFVFETNHPRFSYMESYCNISMIYSIICILE